MLNCFTITTYLFSNFNSNYHIDRNKQNYHFIRPKEISSLHYMLFSHVFKICSWKPFCKHVYFNSCFARQKLHQSRSQGPGNSLHLRAGCVLELHSFTLLINISLYYPCMCLHKKLSCMRNVVSM